MAEPVLVISDLVKNFGALRATDHVDLDLRPGEIHALIGPNGAGKSTLINQIAGTIRPDSGTITFDGEEITSFGVSERARRGLGRTFQVSSLAPEFSALRNVMLAVQAVEGSSFRFFRPVMRDARLVEPAMAALERVGLAGRASIPAAGRLIAPPGRAQPDLAACMNGRRRSCVLQGARPPTSRR